MDIREDVVRGRHCYGIWIRTNADPMDDRAILDWLKENLPTYINVTWLYLIGSAVLEAHFETFEQAVTFGLRWS